MRAFLVLFFLFSLSVSTFQKWLNDLKGNSQYQVISDHMDGNGDRDIIFKFSLNPQQYYLVAHLKKSHSGTVRCAFVPDEKKMKEDMQKEKNELMEQDMRLKKLLQVTEQKLQLIENRFLEWNLGHQEMNQKMSKKRHQYVEGAIGILEDYKMAQREQMDIQAKISELRRLESQYKQKESVIFRDDAVKKKVVIYFRPNLNEGEIGWVGATKYLLYGTSPPNGGFGAIAMKHVMALFDQWMNPDRDGSVYLEDVSEKHVDDAFWDPLSAFSLWRSRILSICSQRISSLCFPFLLYQQH